VEDACGGGSLSQVTFAVASSDLSGDGVASAAEQDMFLAVPRELLRDALGETTELLVWIDRATPAVTPPARRLRRLPHQPLPGVRRRRLSG
jgi:hypothetical protein